MAGRAQPVERIMGIGHIGHSQIMMMGARRCVHIVMMARLGQCRLHALVPFAAMGHRHAGHSLDGKSQHDEPRQKESEQRMHLVTLSDSPRHRRE